MINKRTYTLLVWTLLAACAFFRVIHAHASLGEGIDSIEADRVTLSATQKSSKNVQLNFSIEELAWGSTTIREYVSSSGTVFGLAWTGPKPPDLNSLLASYAGEYASSKAETTRSRGRQPRPVASSHLVVETWGHMRKLQGHAYDPSLLPSGVSAHDIQ